MRVVLPLTACVFLYAVLSIARHSSPTFPVSDEAVIELSTLNALEGRQLLGPYSRYAWHHPGPALFYALAPFYGVSGRRATALSAGALTINVAALAVALWVLFQRGGPALAVAFAVVGALYLGRLGGMLVSPWNAHVAILTAAGVIVTGAAAAAGSPGAIPVAALLASFAIQTHIAVVPLVAVVGLLVLIGVARAFLSPAQQPAVGRTLDGSEPQDSSGNGPRLSRAVNLAVWVLLALWLVPLVEQLMPGAGNISHMWQFATGPSGGAAPAIAFEAWADTITAPLRPGLTLPRGLLLPHDGAAWSGSIAILEVLLLPAVAWWAHRRGRRFHLWLAVELFLVSCAGLWAASRIPDGIHDHEVFWMSAVGALNIAAIGAAMISAVSVQRRSVSSTGQWLAAGVSFLFVVGVAALGVGELRRVADRSRLMTRADIRVDGALRAVEAEIARTGAKKPKVLIDQPVWEPAAGVILQLRKKGMPIAVQPGLERLFSGTLAADGTEDLEITFCGGPCHERLAARPDNNVVLFGDGLAIDAVPLLR